MEAYELLEKKFASEIGCENTVAVSSGTAALHLAFEVLRWSHNLDRQSRVAVPDYTMVACPRAVTMAGLQPYFYDCGGDLNMVLPKHADVNAIMAVHIYGKRCEDVSEWVKTDIPVIEDMAELHCYSPNPYSFAACWSFYKNKVIHGEEGGMISFRHPQHAKRARMLRSLGFTDKHDYSHVPRGVNARMSNTHAELVLKSLTKLDDNLDRRWKLYRAYNVAGLRDYLLTNLTSPWVYPLLVPGMTYEQQTEIVNVLNDKGVAARHGFKPMSSQTEYNWPRLAAANKNAYELAPQVMYLPLTETLTEAEVKTYARYTLEIVQKVMNAVD